MKIPIRTLESKEKKLVGELRKLRDTIETRRLELEIPKLKKSFEGKCFKYRNSYSCPTEESDYWFVYAKVLKVLNDREVEAVRFQRTKDGKIEIEKGSYYISSLGLGDEISHEDYETARQECKICAVMMLAY